MQVIINIEWLYQALTEYLLISNML
jgi:hypothetical protein